MIIKKCDRCGAIIEDCEKHKNVFAGLFAAIKRTTTYEITYKITKCVDGLDEPLPMDLCEKCNNDLKEWLHVPKEEKRPETEKFIIAKMPDDIGGNSHEHINN